VRQGSPRYAVVTAVRDEAENLPRLAMCLMSQTLQPSQWIVVDTGSTDDSVVIATQLCSLKRWVVATAMPGPPRPARGAPVVDALHHGLAHLTGPYDYVLKIDADVSFRRDHVEELLRRFTDDPRLGIASGIRYERIRGRWRARGTTAATVDAQLRAYRSTCLRDLLPLERRMGWDVLDESRALSRGWRTARIEEIKFRHHRAIGARDVNRRSAWSKQGEIAHYVGYRPSYLFLRALYRSIRDPAALFMISRFASAKMLREPTSTDCAAVDVRRSQQRLRHLLVRASESLRIGRAPTQAWARADLLIATNAGGHLVELVSLNEVFRPYSRVWVTQDTEDAREFLADERVVYVHAAGTRSAVHLARNLLTALRVVRRVRPRVAITTGSAIAVPFLWIARLFGSRLVVIESGGRAEGESMSRRLLAPIADRVYVQWKGQARKRGVRLVGKASLARPRALAAQLGDTQLLEGIELVVTVGTCEYPFERLLHAVEDSARSDALVLAQCGSSHYRPRSALCIDFLSPSALMACMRSARVVVCHGGMGSVALSLAAGQVPIVVPRLSRFGEHVDDHQLAFAREARALGLATVVEDDRRLGDAIRVVLEAKRPLRRSPVPDLAPDLDQYLARFLQRTDAGTRAASPLSGSERIDTSARALDGVHRPSQHAALDPIGAKTAAR
jgi:UDP-N-acetylglucosamine transferase subunit ALG13/glycosyltransferase involved in cell wall biosynthesis